MAKVDIANIAAYAAQGGLVALSDYGDFGNISGNYLDAPLSTNLYQGKYYGLPLDTNCKAAVVNKNILKELGLEDVPVTMEAFIEAAKNRGTYSLNVSGVGDWDMYPYYHVPPKNIYRASRIFRVRQGRRRREYCMYFQGG